MTIGIATVLPNGVLVLADGRQRWVAKDDVETDDLTKIFVVQDIALVSIGIWEVTAPAIELLTSSELPTRTEEICLEVDDALSTAWRERENDLSPHINLNDPRAHATLLVGGYSESGPFVSERVMTVGGSANTGIIDQVFDSRVVCRNRQNAYLNYQIQMFEKGVNRNTARSEELISSLLHAGATVANTMAINDNTIGGTLRYALVLGGGQPEIKTFGVVSREENG